MVKVVTVRRTGEPEELVCTTARGDYFPTPPWQHTFEEVMEPIEGDTLEEKKENFIEYLMLAGHWGPFEHPVITLGIEDMSRVTLAQLTRHRIASFDIQSGRYARMKMERFNIPPSFHAEEVVSRKGGKEQIKLGEDVRFEAWNSLLHHAFEVYDMFREAGIPVEDARFILPEGISIHGHMTVNARSLMHIIALRTLGDAQWEIQDLTNQALERAKEWMPLTFSLFEKRLMNKRTTIAP